MTQFVPSEPVFGPVFTAVRLKSDRSTVYVTAVGVNPTSGYRTFFYIGPELIFPQRLHFANIPPSDFALQVLTPYAAHFAYKETLDPVTIPSIPAPSGDWITIITATGTVNVPILDEDEPVKPTSADAAAAVGGIHLKGFAAWINEMPPGPGRLVVTGAVETPTTGWAAKLVEAVPQGFNPGVKLLNLELTPPSGIVAQHVTDVPVRFDESPAKVEYSEVQIAYLRMKIALKVNIVSYA